MVVVRVKVGMVACLQAVCGCFYRGKTPENAEFAIAGAILDARENLVTRPRPVFARVQDSAGDGELPDTPTPTNRLQEGYWNRG